MRWAVSGVDFAFYRVCDEIASWLIWEPAVSSASARGLPSRDEACSVRKGAGEGAGEGAGVLVCRAKTLFELGLRTSQ